MKILSNEITPPPTGATPELAPEVILGEFRRNMGQISRHSITFFAGTLFTMGGGYLVKIYVARVLGAEQLGLYALGMTLVTLTQMVSNLGLHVTTARYVAVYNATRRFEDLRGFLTRSVGTVLLLTLLFSIGLIFAGGWLGRRLYHAPDLGQYMPLFGVLTVLGSVSTLYGQVLAGFKDIIKRTVINNFIGTALVIALTVLLLYLGTGMRGYLWAQILNSLASVSLLVAVACKLTPPAARFSWRRIPPLDPEVKAFAAAAFGMNAVEFLVSQADKVLLGFYLNPALVGIYVVASTISGVIPLILQSVNQIFAPVIADLHSRDRIDVLQRLFQTLTKWVFGLTLPVALVVIAFARPLMRIFGPAFETGWPVLVIGAVGQLVNCGVGSVGYLLLMSGNQKRLMRVQFVMVGVSLIINITLIPVFGLVGAALAAAVVNVAANVWNLLEVRKALEIFPYNRSYFAWLIPAALSATSVVFLRYSIGATFRPWIGILAAVALAYIAFWGIALMFALDENDRVIATSAWAQLRDSVQRR
jgi:O-antigen/teichoic acid export membrane protein